MVTVTNAGSVGKTESIEAYRERTARSWDKLGASVQPDHIHLADRVIAQDFRDGKHDPRPLLPRIFDLRTERFVD